MKNFQDYNTFKEDKKLKRIRYYQGSFKDFKDFLNSKIKKDQISLPNQDESSSIS